MAFSEADTADSEPLVRSSVLGGFSESGESLDLIRSLPRIHGDTVKVEATTQRFLVIMNRYQEQPHLLDPHLESMLSTILEMVQSESAPPSLLHLSFKFLYIICKVRGYKTFMQLFPHEVAHLHPVLHLLCQQDPRDSQTWETRYMLLLWLSMTCLIPFDLSRLDGSADATQPTMDRILAVAKSYLQVSDTPRDAASVLVSKFMTRPDVRQKHLAGFLDWSLSIVTHTADCSMTGIMELDGALQALAKLFKHGKRDDLLQSAPAVLKVLDRRRLSESGQATLRKLAVKVTQRLGLTFLKPRLAAWRYQRGSRSLAANLSVSGASVAVEAQQQSEEEDYDIPEEVEAVIEQLLVGLKDKETIVRWSAAKGIGRVTGRLPKELADEVVGSVLDCFSFQETDHTWHGGCLALAELGRRGLLLPARLTEVVPLIIKSLSYEEKRGACSVGANVRDAACYVCWSFARAYEPKELQPHVQQLASALLITAVFDRNVNCRRAASAAFQENVGRQGTFPHGIDILTAADYYAVGNLSHCYLTISVHVASFPEYSEALVEHLVTVKIGHWDANIRELAAKALHNLTATVPDYMANTVMPQLLRTATAMDLHGRHGAILACAEVTHALYQVAASSQRSVVELLSPDSVEALKNIHQTLLDRKQYRGFGGQLMRPAVCLLIEKLSLSKMPFKDEAVIAGWQWLIDDTIDTLRLAPAAAQESITAAVLSALSSLCEEFYQLEAGGADPDRQNVLVCRYSEGLQSPHVVTRCACAGALGCLPSFIIHNKLTQILDSLQQMCSSSQKDESMTEARRDAVRAVSQVCVKVGVCADGGPEAALCSRNLASVYDFLLANINDYTTDSRGDVGAWVREAAMSSLMEVTLMASGAAPDILSADHVRLMMCGLVQQAAEKIDRYRAHAGAVFLELLHSQQPAVPHIPHREELLDIFPVEVKTSLNWNAPSQAFPYISRLLALPQYQYHALLGLTVSVGGITESTVHFSSQSLFDYLRGIQDDQEALTQFGTTLLSIFRDNLRNDKVCVPFLKMLNHILSNSCFETFTTQENHPLCVELLSLCKEVKKSKDVSKLHACISVFCGLMQFQGDVRKKVLSQLLMLLCHPFPVVRKTTSGQLYETLLTFDDLVDAAVLDEVMSLLSDTNWESDLASVRPHRNQLCDWMGVARPQLVAKNPVQTS